MKTFQERFWAKVDKTNPEGCWLWTAANNGNGYGVIRYGSRNEYVHRVSYMIHVGEIPPGLQVDHVCHNRACVNPDHLRTCTVAQNVRNALLRSDNTTGYKCVTKAWRPGKWVAQIRKNGKVVHIGTFNSPEEAHAAYVKESQSLWGEFANPGVLSHSPDRTGKDQEAA